MTDIDWSDVSDLDSELEKFRNDWKHELNNRNFMQSGRIAAQEDNVASSTRLYKLAASYEQRGSINEALSLYRQALRCCPDVEQFLEIQATGSQQQYVTSTADSTCATENVLTDEGQIDIEVFRLKLSVGSVDAKHTLYCSPASSTDNFSNGSKAHISCLPAELLLYIFGFVASDQLDYRQLEQLSMVCRGFYVLCRNEELWKSACRCVWGGVHCAMKRLHSRRQSADLTWRQVFLATPRIHFNGIYVSKISYVRKGEDNSFCDRAFAQQWHLVTYYRYVRFFPDGFVTMITSADEPYSVLPDLRSRACSRNTALIGRYKIEGDPVDCGLVVMWIERQRSAKYGPSAGLSERDQTFSMQLRIGSTKRRKFCRLHWLTYTLIERRKDGTDNINELTISDKTYPPLYFSRVRSYCTVSSV